MVFRSHRVASRGKPEREAKHSMFDTRDQILNQLRAGEDGRAEFKDVRLGK